MRGLIERDVNNERVYAASDNDNKINFLHSTSHEGLSTLSHYFRTLLASTRMYMYDVVTSM